MIINRSYKFRLYPNNEQKVLINKTIGCNRFIYNYFLNERIIMYKENKKSKSKYELIKEIPFLYIDKPYLKEIDSMSLRCNSDLDRDINVAENIMFEGVKMYMNDQCYA